MSLKGIISIAKVPGLYKVVAQTKAGFIVESITDKKRMAVSSTQRISMLEDISIYCTSGDKPLREVLLKMKEQDAASSAVSAKADTEELKKYFATILPDFDQERVYTSDIQKIIKWYQSLKDLVSFEADEAEKPEEDAAEEGKEAVAADKKVKTTKAKEDHTHAKTGGTHQAKASTEKKVVASKTRKKV